MTIKIYYTADGLPPYPIFKDDGETNGMCYVDTPEQLQEVINWAIAYDGKLEITGIEYDL